MPPCPQPAVVLASASPRRHVLLTRAGVAFEVRSADVPEVRAEGETPGGFALRLARDKAEAVADRLDGAAARFVIGADTIVVVDEDVLGKPRDAAHAEALLGRLVGREHRVLTGVAVLARQTGQAYDVLVESSVRMRPASAAEVRRYIATGEPLDKAGAYALQGEGRRFVEAVEGSETNVIGLPVEQTLALLRSAGWTDEA